MKRKLIFLLIGILSLFLVDCSGENPFVYAEDDLSGMERTARNKDVESQKQANGDNEKYDDSNDFANDYGNDFDDEEYGGNNDYGGGDNDPSGDSLNKDDKSYIQNSKTMVLTLTYFEALKDWDPLSGADPIISFQIKVELDDGTIKSYDSGTLLDVDDYERWVGEKTQSFTLPVYSKNISICPIVYDDEGLGTTDRNSGKCYSHLDIGRLDDGEIIHQNDEYNENCIVKWEWYLD